MVGEPITMPANELSITRLADGSAIISDGNTVLAPWTVAVRIFDQVGMVQMGTGLAWTPIVKLTGTSDASTATFGDYEITVRRVKPKRLSNDGVINLRKARRFRAEGK